MSRFCTALYDRRWTPTGSLFVHSQPKASILLVTLLYSVLRIYIELFKRVRNISSLLPSHSRPLLYELPSLFTAKTTQINVPNVQRRISTRKSTRKNVQQCITPPLCIMESHVCLTSICSFGHSSVGQVFKGFSSHVFYFLHRLYMGRHLPKHYYTCNLLTNCTYDFFLFIYLFFTLGIVSFISIFSGALIVNVARYGVYYMKDRSLMEFKWSALLTVQCCSVLMQHCCNFPFG